MTSDKLRLKPSVDGIRVNWVNVPYFTVKEIKNDETTYLKFTFQYRFKASIKTQEGSFVGTLKQLDMVIGSAAANLFKKFYDGMYINTSKILLIREEYINGSVDKVDLEFVFVDSMRLQYRLTAEQWSWWRSRYL